MKFHHIGIVSKNISKNIDAIKKNYHTVDISPIIHDEQQNADLCMIHTDNGIDFELISGELVASIINKGINYYHLCFSVADIGQQQELMKKNGAIVISPPKPAKLFGDKRVAFLYTDIGIIELLED